MITAYLMGELSEPEQEQMEVRYFTDDDLFQRLLALEDDLINRYARGVMSDGERKRCERYFMKSPARRERVGLVSVPLGGEPAGARRLSWWRALRGLWRPKSPN